MPTKQASLNGALRAYVATVSSPNRLRKFLAREGYLKNGTEGDGVESSFTDVKKALDAVIADVYDALWNVEGGVVWSPDFEHELHLDLRRRHAWLTKDGLEPLLSLGRWYCWHEGLNRPEQQS